MKKMLIIGMIFLLYGCQSKQTSTLDNGGFETGDLTGWTSEGDAFLAQQVTNTLVYGEYNRKYYHEGNYHLVGSQNSSATGSLKSTVFRIESTGFITFLIAGGFNYNKTYVGLYDAKTHELLDKKFNQMFHDPNHTDGYVRVIWDVTKYQSKSVYLKVVDEDTSHYFGYLNIDDFRINLTESELAYYQKDALIRLGHATSDDMLEAINRYIDMNAWKVSKETRMNYHVTGEMGWINDPNGFVFYKGKNHLFYQHNPKDIVWGPMHWGHVVSDDLVKWEYLPIALAPDQPYDSNGVFSGSAIVIEDKLYLIYTGNIPNRQIQAIAYSDNGIEFTKHENNPVINEYKVPAGASVVDFRDPKVWKYEDFYYMVVGSRQTSQNYGQILMYKSADLVEWTYVGAPYKGSSQTFDKLGRMWECPDIFLIGDKHVLLFSPQEVPNHRNHNSTVYVVGNLNYQTGKLENVSYNNIEEIDHGFDFYAPQTMLDDQGRRIMIAWMQSWNRTPVTSGLGFAGAMTLPRVLSLVDGKLYQTPISEIENYRQNPINRTIIVSNDSISIPGLSGVSNELLITLAPNNYEAGIKLFKGENEETKVYYKDGFLVLDRTNGTSGKVPTGDLHNITKIPVTLQNGSVQLRIFIDKYSVEVFVNNGRYVITTTVFPSLSARGIEFYSYGQATFNIEGYDLVIE